MKFLAAVGRNFQHNLKDVGLVSAFVQEAGELRQQAVDHGIDVPEARIKVFMDIQGPLKQKQVQQLHQAVMNYDPGKGVEWRGAPKHVDCLHLKPPCNRAGVPQ